MKILLVEPRIDDYVMCMATVALLVGQILSKVGTVLNSLSLSPSPSFSLSLASSFSLYLCFFLSLSLSHSSLPPVDWGWDGGGWDWFSNRMYVGGVAFHLDDTCCVTVQTTLESWYVNEGYRILNYIFVCCMFVDVTCTSVFFVFHLSFSSFLISQ